MSLFPTKYVADVDTLEISSSSSKTLTLEVGGEAVLTETYSPANGKIYVRGLRNVLEAAIYGELTTGAQSHAAAIVELKEGNTVVDTPAGAYLYASRLRNPRDPQGQKNIMAAGDLVAVCGPEGLITPALYSAISSNAVAVTQYSEPAETDIGDGIHLWIDRTACPEKAVAVRFLNRYDVPQTMMTTEPLQDFVGRVIMISEIIDRENLTAGLRSACRRTAAA